MLDWVLVMVSELVLNNYCTGKGLGKVSGNVVHKKSKICLEFVWYQKVTEWVSFRFLGLVRLWYGGSPHVLGPMHFIS